MAPGSAIEPLHRCLCKKLTLGHSPMVAPMTTQHSQDRADEKSPLPPSSAVPVGHGGAQRVPPEA